MRALPLAVLFLVAAAGGTSPAAVEKPNVVVILCDDLGFSDLGCYGGEIRTPVLDRLAAGGLRFSQFYNTAKCAETRATLLSGRYHNEVGIAALRDCWTLAEAMKTAGYFTAMAGKWHLSKEPTDRGFDRYFGHLSGATNFFTGDKTFRLNGEPFKVPETGFYTTDADTDYAIRFIEESRETGKPFFCYLAYNAPHYPLHAPEEDVRRYMGKYTLGWDELRKRRYARQKEIGILGKEWPLSPRPDDVPAWDSLSPERKDQEDLRMAAYAAMIDRMDRQIGRLVTRLETLEVLDNTLILFMSDNGGCPFERTKDRSKMPWDPTSYWTYDKGWAHACNTPFRWYKRNQHEGGISTPMIAHWPEGITAKKGSITRQPGHLVDVMATLLDITGTTYPSSYQGRTLKPLRGKSLLPVFRGEKREGHEALFFDWGGQHQAVRMGPWKLVKVNRGPWELYNLDDDRTELKNLVSAEPERAEAMAMRWEAWAKEAGVRLKGRKKKKK